MNTSNLLLARLRHHITGAIERGEAQAIAGTPAKRTMHTWRVTLKHDAGTVRLTLRAASYSSAVANACAAERAPESAVVSCAIVETPKQRRKSVRLCQNFAKGGAS